jgi:hypothetical protein
MGVAASIITIELSNNQHFARVIAFIPAITCMSALFSALSILHFEIQNGGLIERLGFRLHLELLQGGTVSPNYGLLVNPNEIAMPLALSAVALFGQDLRSKGMAIRSARLFLVAISAAMVVLTQSRSMLIAFVFGVFAASRFGAWRWAWRPIALFAVGLLVVWAILGVEISPLDLLQRFDLEDSDLMSFGDRTELWRTSFSRCLDEPIFGPSALSRGTEMQFSPHNAFLSSAELAGVFGIALLTLIYLQPLAVSIRERSLSFGTLVALVTASLAMDTLPKPVFWLMYACALVGLQRVRPNEQQRPMLVC